MFKKNEIRHLLHVQTLAAEPLPSSLREHGWIVRVAQNPFESQQLARSNRFSVGLVSFDGQPLTAIHEVVNGGGAIEWIALVRPHSLARDDVVRFICENCYDYHTLPIDAERLKITLGRACGLASLKQNHCVSRPSPADQLDHYEMIGDSAPMQHIYRSIAKIARLEAAVLITGETGTGKEQTACAIHANSSRAHRPLIAVNCAALPGNLLQSELFGHEKGSFTGAFGRRIGRIEAAEGGTLFLDEIGDLRLDLQVTLLRFLEEKTIERVGGSTPIKVDVRVIAATNANLKAAVEAGRFREDLYYRLNVLRIKLPPLRDRPRDVEMLARYFFEKFTAKQVGGLHINRVKGFSSRALHALTAHHWPGNVRELQNRMHRAVVMCDTSLITPGDLGLKSMIMVNPELRLKAARDRAEKQIIELALASNKDRIAATARMLDVSQMTLYRLLKKHAIGMERVKALRNTCRNTTPD